MNITVKKSTLLAVLVSLGVTATPAYADGWSGSIRGVLGSKQIDKDDWGKDHKRHSSVGLIMDVKPTSWPISVAVDMFGTGEHKPKERDYEGFTSELHLGARANASFFQQRVQPYVGGGFAAAYAKEQRYVNGLKKSDEGTGVGAWAGVGVDVKVSKAISLGLDARYSSAKADVFEKKRQIGGMNIGVSLGYHF